MFVFITALAVIAGLLVPFIFKADLQQSQVWRDKFSKNYNALLDLLLGTNETGEEVAKSTRQLMGIAVVALLGSFVLLYQAPLIGFGIGVAFAFIFANEIKHFLAHNKLTRKRFGNYSMNEEPNKLDAATDSQPA